MAKRRPRVSQKRNQAFACSLYEELLKLGAIEYPTSVPLVYLQLTTKAGTLILRVSPNSASPGASVYARFENVDAAKLLGLFHLNPYSGKWNHHFFTESVEDSIRVLRYELSKVLEPVE